MWQISGRVWYLASMIISTIWTSCGDRSSVELRALWSLCIGTDIDMYTFFIIDKIKFHGRGDTCGSEKRRCPSHGLLLVHGGTPASTPPICSNAPKTRPPSAAHPSPGSHAWVPQIRAWDLSKKTVFILTPPSPSSYLWHFSKPVLQRQQTQVSSWVPPHVWIDSCSEIMLKTNCPRFEYKAYERMYAFPFCVSTVGTRWCRCASGGERSSLLMTLGPPSIHCRRISLGT